jgi:hypothetical protein
MTAPNYRTTALKRWEYVRAHLPRPSNLAHFELADGYAADENDRWREVPVPECPLFRQYRQESRRDADIQQRRC